MDKLTTDLCRLAAVLDCRCSRGAPHEIDVVGNHRDGVFEISWIRVRPAGDVQPVVAQIRDVFIGLEAEGHRLSMDAVAERDVDIFTGAARKISAHQRLKAIAHFR